MKKFSLLENFKYTDEEIEDFFIEYTDENGDVFKLENGYINKDNDFFKDVASVISTTKQCKHITIRLEDVAKGIHGNSGDRCMTNVDLLTKLLTTIKTFAFKSETPLNFYLENSYDDIILHFYIVGGPVDNTHLKSKDDIKMLLTELVPIIKGRGYKRVTLKNTNWLEIRTPAKGNGYYSPSYYLHDTLRKGQDETLPNDERNKPLIDWFKKMTDSGYNMNNTGGDNQVVIRLKKI